MPVRSKPSLVLLIIVALAVIAASCGVSREATADIAVTTIAEAVGGESSDGETPSTIDIPTPDYTAPDYGDIDTAATLNFADGTTAEIPVGDVTVIIDQIDDSPDAAELVFDGGLPATFDLDILSSLIQVEILEKALGDENVTIDNGAVQAELAVLDGQLEGLVAAQPDPAGAKATIQAGVSEYLELIATQRVSQNAYTDLFTDDGDVEVPCVSHILVETEAEALAAVVRLDAGEDFAELAMELSTGPSGPQGGDLGCSDPSAFAVEFKDAVEAATIGEVVGPVATQFGFHLILVSGTDLAPPDPTVAQQRAFEGYTAIQASTQVVVDPAIGQWDSVATRVSPL